MISTNRFIEYSIVGVFVLSILVLLGITLVQPDVEMIINHPWKFLIETIVIGIVPAVALTIFVYTRNTKIKNVFKWVLLLAAKFVVIHILFQTSGFYGYFLAD